MEEGSNMKAMPLDECSAGALGKKQRACDDGENTKAGLHTRPNLPKLFGAVIFEPEFDTSC